MRAALLVDSEILAILYLKTVQSLQRVLQLTLTRAVETKPLSVFDAAQQVRDSAQVEFAKRCKMLKSQWEHLIPPKWTTSEFHPVRLSVDCTYSVKSDERNTTDVALLVGTDGVVKRLQPGEVLSLKGINRVEVQSSKPCLLEWSRVGGVTRVGDLQNTIPLPRRNIVKPVEPTPPPKKKLFGLW